MGDESSRCFNPVPTSTAEPEPTTYKPGKILVHDTFFGSVKELKESQSSFVRPFVRSFLTCLELLFFIFWHQILQDDFRSVSGKSQVSLRAVSGLSVLTSSDRRSLKYFVLFSEFCHLRHRRRSGVVTTWLHIWGPPLS